MANLGNVVGLIRSQTAPTKTYVIWAHQYDPLDLNKTELKQYDANLGIWIPLATNTKTVDESASFTIDEVTHKNAVIYLRGNNITVTVPNTVSIDFGCSFRSIGTGNKVSLPSGFPVIGDVVGLTDPYELIDNGTAVLIRTASDFDLTGNFI